MYMASDIAIDEIKTYIGNWKSYSSNSQKIAELKMTFNNIEERMLSSLEQVKVWGGKIMGAAFTGFTSGIVGTLVTTVVNSLVTTVATWGKILQDGLSTFINGFKTFVTNPNNLPKDQLIKSVIKMIGVGLGTTIGLVVGEKLNEELTQIPNLPKFLIDSISTGIGAFVSGFLSALVITSVDNFGLIIKKFKSAWDDVVQGNQISIKQVEETYNQTLKNIDESYEAILKSIEEEYRQLGKLSKLAHDMSVLASNQLFASVNYARASGVLEDTILHNKSEIDNYFLGGK